MDRLAERREALAKATEPERRRSALKSAELRADDGAGKLQFRGRAAVFDEWTEIHDLFGSFEERIQRGSFKRVLKDDADVRFLINHTGLPLARTASGTMDLRESAKGLEVDADLADTTLARDLAVLLDRGDIDQMSFAFRVAKDVWEYDEENDTARRTIVEFSDLYDVSPVTFPAYEGTSAGMRALGVDLTDEGRAMDLALRIFRGDLTANEEERAAIDAALLGTPSVTPWMAERAARAVAQEPELRAALQGRGVTLDAQDEQPSGPTLSVEAARRRLHLLAIAGE